MVKGGILPYRPEALAKRDANRAAWSELDPEVKCYLPGIPRANYLPQPFQIFQGVNSIEFVYQFAGANRNILMQDPGPAPADSWMGQSVASWEGDTLVIEVTAQNADTWFDRSGNHHSAAMTVVERFTPMGPNHLRYEATIDDPEDLHRTVDDGHAPLPPHGTERHAARLQVRGVRGGTALWRTPTAPVAPVGARLGLARVGVANGLGSGQTRATTRVAPTGGDVAMKPIAATFLAALVAAAPGASAHHAFGAEFDPNLPLQLRGPIVRIEWVNPHAWFHVEHTNEDGTKTVWMVEAGTPNTLFRRGDYANDGAGGDGGDH